MPIYSENDLATAARSGGWFQAMGIVMSHSTSRTGRVTTTIPPGRRMPQRGATRSTPSCFPRTACRRLQLRVFYARNGHADEALPLLRAALRARPDLRTFALDDADIEPIRDDPRVESLLGP